MEKDLDIFDSDTKVPQEPYRTIYKLYYLNNNNNKNTLACY